MANIIKLAYWECDGEKNTHATQVDKDYFKRIAFSECFQMEVALIRLRFRVEVDFENEPPVLNIFTRQIMAAKNWEEAIKALAFGYRFADRWLDTLGLFVRTGEILLPEQTEKANPVPWLGDALYATDRLSLRIVKDKNFTSAVDGIVKPRLLLELEADTRKEDLLDALPHINKAQKKYFHQKRVRMKLNRTYELLNFVLACKKAGASYAEIKGRIIQEGYSKTVFGDDDIHKMLKEADELGF